MRVVSTRSYRFCGASRFLFTDAAAAPASNSPAVAARGTKALPTKPKATEAQAVPNSEGGCGGVVSSKAATSVDDPAVATSTCSPAVTSAVSVDPSANRTWAACSPSGTAPKAATVRSGAGARWSTQAPSIIHGMPVFSSSSSEDDDSTSSAPAAAHLMTVAHWPALCSDDALT